MISIYVISIYLAKYISVHNWRTPPNCLLLSQGCHSHVISFVTLQSRQLILQIRDIIKVKHSKNKLCYYGQITTFTLFFGNLMNHKRYFSYFAVYTILLADSAKKRTCIQCFLCSILQNFLNAFQNCGSYISNDVEIQQPFLISI